MKLFRSLSLMAALSLATLGAVAQTAVTSLHGTIADQSGALVPDAHVSLSNPDTGFKSDRISDSHGEYAFEQIAPGRYSVVAQSSGFAAQKVTVELLVNQARTVDFKLSVAAATAEIVDVVETASTLNASDATVGTPFDTPQIQTLPFEGNNVLDLLSLQAGVLFLGDKTSSQQDTDSRSGSVDGARSDQSNVTLDGLDDNDQNKGYAFSGVLRSTRDSVEEFRVVTTNANADSGRSSGAQVSLVTRSGTNAYHASMYEYYRPTNTVANNWFNKQAEVAAGEPNIPPKYLRNTFGGSFGAPIKKDKLFYFVAYEGQRTAESQQVTQEVPSAAFRNGSLTYVAASGSTVTLDQAQIAKMDPNCTKNGSCPLGAGVDPAALAYYATLPLPNSQAPNDGYNLFGYTFASAAPQSLETLIAKVDYNIHANHRLFLRLNAQSDHTYGAAQFPGQPSSFLLTDDSKGIAVGDIWTISNSLVNNVRYGLVHQSYANHGVTDQNYVTFQNISTLKASGFTSQVISVPTHNIVDDITWNKGAHTFQAGGNYRLVFNNRQSNATLFSNAAVTYQLLAVGAIANTSVQGQPPASLDPGGFGFPAVSTNYDTAYNTAIADITGLITSSTVYYNNLYSNGELSPLPPGQWVNHQYITNEAEYYGQDSWKLRQNLTLSLGLRQTLLQVPYERNGQEIAPTVDMGGWFDARAKASAAGQVVQPPFGFIQAGRANGKPGLWSMDKADLAPRVAVAYAVNPNTTFRTGFGIYYDHFGQGIIDSFDQQGSFGLVTADRSPVGQYVDTTPRYSNQTTVPTSIVPTLSVTGKTPVTPGDNLSLAWGVDQSLTTPYSYVFNSSVQHQFSRFALLEATYTGRLGRHLMQMRDISTPNDLVDPKSGLDYFAAAKLLSKLTDAGAKVSSVAKIPYWENMFPWIAGGGLTATQVAYENYQPFRGNEASALFVLDAIPGLYTPNNELYRYFDPQYSSLYTWSSMGTSSYHGLQLAMHHQESHGLQFDLYYTLSKSIDLGSDAERTGPSTETIGGSGGYYSGSGGYFSQIINVYNPKGNRAVSDFDVHHSITANVIGGLPFGRGKMIGSNANKFTNALIGNWTLTGLTHWTSGLPFGSIDGIGWSTDWADQSWVVNTAAIPSGGHKHDVHGLPNAFASQATALANIRPPYAGETGQRNAYRGDGYFSVDSGLSKILDITEKQELKFAWETFNATNSVRFDPASISDNPYGSPGSYGEYTALLSQGRRMQLSLRYSF
ncbi:MAG: carboxypeptidase-like regulatory domain-containing protein [Terracidiphilus sp.]